MSEIWYLATCQDCTPVLPQPFSDPAERDRWAQVHAGATGHVVELVREERHHAPAPWPLKQRLEELLTAKTERDPELAAFVERLRSLGPEPPR